MPFNLRETGAVQALFLSRSNCGLHMIIQQSLSMDVGFRWYCAKLTDKGFIEKFSGQGFYYDRFSSSISSHGFKQDNIGDCFVFLMEWCRTDHEGDLFYVIDRAYNVTLREWL
jgi:hypothetical protein